MEIGICDQKASSQHFKVLFERSSVYIYMLIFDGSAIVNLSLWLCGAVFACVRVLLEAPGRTQDRVIRGL